MGRRVVRMSQNIESRAADVLEDVDGIGRLTTTTAVEVEQQASFPPM